MISDSRPQQITAGPQTMRFPIFYGWVCVVFASLAMTATLPGRTHGLGLITESLLTDLDLQRVSYARMNQICTLLGASFCLPIGWSIDRYGVRRVLTLTVACLGVSVQLMATATSEVTLFAGLLGVRGFGQGALSVVSMSIVGKWFQRRLGPAMGLFSVLLTFGFVVSILGMGSAIQDAGWRTAWSGLGWCLLGFVPFCWWLMRDTPESCGLLPDGARPDSTPTASDDAAQMAEQSVTWQQALTSPAFWTFAGGTAAFNLVWSAITLFNESILAEKGFDASAAVQVMAILTGTGLLANLVAGGLVSRKRLGMLLGCALAVLALSLAAFPHISTQQHLWCYGGALGISGGIITVVFFAAWGQIFGRDHLGRIQSTAQIVSILASATGPLLMAESHAWCGTYREFFYFQSALVGLAALAAFGTRLPRFSIEDNFGAVEHVPAFDSGGE